MRSVNCFYLRSYMKLTVLGKYGPFSINKGSTSGYLVENANEYALLDVGSGVLSKMLDRIDIHDLKFLFLSHLHFDHISDFGVLSYAVSFLKKDKKLKVYMYDDNSDISNVIKNVKAFDCVFIKENTIYNEGNFTFSFLKMTHPVISHAIKISNGDKVLAYTGDTTLNDNLELLIKDSNMLVADGAFLKDDYNDKLPHMSVEQVNNLSQKYKVNTIISHINYKNTDKLVKSEIKGNKLIKIAKEEKTYKV